MTVNERTLAAKDSDTPLKQARAAMHSSNWGQAAVAFRRHLEQFPDDTESKILYGQCLKALGFYERARSVYLEALPRASDKAGLLIHLGHLCKANGEFARASSYFQEALEQGETTGEQRAHCRDQIVHLRRYAPPSDIRFQGEMPVFFSCPVLKTNDTHELDHIQLGKSEYSYGFAARGFVRALEQMGVAANLVEHPEYLSHVSRISEAAHNLHLRFSPPTNPRLIKGAYNILLFAWEFDELPLESNWPHPFADRRAIMERYDEVWVPSSHAAEVLSGLTKAKIRYVPSPVLPGDDPQFWHQGRFKRRALSPKTLEHVRFAPLAVFPRLQHRFLDQAVRKTSSLTDIIARQPGGRAKIFLTVANPHDQRKQLRPLIEGFMRYAEVHDDAILLIKSSAGDFTTQSINNLIFTHQLVRENEMLHAFYSERIWINNENLPEKIFDELYSIADFYICAPIAEGQNLPLLEAMIRGCVPVSPCHTAMRDYIDDDNAVVIASSRQPATVPLQRIYGLHEAMIDVVSPADVADAIALACAMPGDAMRDKRDKAIATVEAKYSKRKLELEYHRLLAQFSGEVQ